MHDNSEKQAEEAAAKVNFRTHRVDKGDVIQVDGSSYRVLLSKKNVDAITQKPLAVLSRLFE